MKNYIIPILFVANFYQSQITNRDKIFTLAKVEYDNLKTYLASKNISVKDTIVIKYDYKNESCWNLLDEQSDSRIKNVLQNFKKHIKDFNDKHPEAIALNFREPGRNFNKLKLWDDSIIIDENLFLKNTIFKKKNMCGNSAIILNDGSYVLRSSDPHFDLLDAIK
ncbi:hypothetical protein [Epilithonimonas hominis]|uniref:hypothetical protein n=1 Tax=Epilithonimonas hominis TaxID=420404 RepID=UPI00289F67BB|nr:hypothetical protein [Epilithonimonas hominis]